MVAAGAEDGEHVRRHPHAVVAFPVVDKQIAADINVGAVAEPVAQDEKGSGHGYQLVFGFGHRFTVGGWVVDFRAGAVR